MADTAERQVIVRVQPAVWAGIALLLASSAPLLILGVSPTGFVTVNRLADGPTRLVVCIVALIGGLAVLWALRASIVLDAQGIRWRSLGSWRSAAWEQVSDYYLLSPIEDGAAVIETSNGRVEISPVFGGVLYLRKYVAAHATNAINDHWAQLGERPVEAWPLVFNYRGRSQRLLPYVFAFCLAVTLTVSCALIARAVVVWHAAGVSWTSVLTAATALLIGAPILVLLYVCIKAAPALTDIGRRVKHTITLSDAGIEFSDGDQTVTAGWAEVLKLVPAGSGTAARAGVICTTNGDIAYSEHLTDVQILSRIVAIRCREQAESNRAASPAGA